MRGVPVSVLSSGVAAHVIESPLSKSSPVKVVPEASISAPFTIQLYAKTRASPSSSSPEEVQVSVVVSNASKGVSVIAVMAGGVLPIVTLAATEGASRSPSVGVTVTDQRSPLVV